MSTSETKTKAPRPLNRYPPRGWAGFLHVREPVMLRAQRQNSSHCMIVQTVRDTIPEATSIAVDLQTIRFSLPSKGIRCTYLTPRIAQEAIVNWDLGFMPKPFSFRLSAAHVTSMWRRKTTATPQSRERTAAEAAAIAKAQAHNPAHQEGKRKREKIEQELVHPELAKKQIRKAANGSGGAAVPIGGQPIPQQIPLSKRRTFGLRGLQLPPATGT